MITVLKLKVGGTVGGGEKRESATFSIAEHGPIFFLAVQEGAILGSECSEIEHSTERYTTVRYCKDTLDLRCSSISPAGTYHTIIGS